MTHVLDGRLTEQCLQSQIGIFVTRVTENIYAHMHSEGGKFQWVFEAFLLMSNYSHRSASDRKHQQWSREAMKLQQQDEEKRAMKSRRCSKD